MARPKVVTVGAATLDAFLTSKAIHAKRDVRTNDYVEQFPLGAKIELDGVEFSTGGGATNAAVTFARYGYATKVISRIGDDVAGREVLASLRSEGIGTDLISVDLTDSTGYGSVLLATNGERTILAYRGSSEKLTSQDLNLSTDLDCLYISSLAGNLNLLKTLLSTATRRNLKIAYNPGAKELAQAAKLRELLKGIDVLSVNKEEAIKLFGKNSLEDLAMEAAQFCNTAAITDGPHGSTVCDGQTLYVAGLYSEAKVIDRTGAGDAYASGLAAALWAGHSVEAAMTFAAANASSVTQHIGSKTGILSKRDRLSAYKITAKPIKV